MKKKVQQEGANPNCHLEIPSYIFITFVSNPFSFAIPQTTGFGAKDCVYPIHSWMKSQLGFIHTTLEYIRVLCLCYSKKLIQVYTKLEEFCFWKAPQLGFYMLKIIAILPRSLFPTLGIKVSLTICMCFECGNGHTVSWQDLFNPISDAIITDSF